MKGETVEGYLAHISDTVTEIAQGLEESRQVQQNILTALNLLIDSQGTHTEMLAEILGAAAQEAGPSPVAEALEALCGQVGHMDLNQAALIANVMGLPVAIGQQFEAALKETSAGTAETGPD